MSQTSPPEPDEPLLERLRHQDTRLDHYIDRYAARAHGMTASAIRALFAVANRPEVVSLAGGMPNITDLPLDVVGSVLNDLVLNDGRRAMQYGSGQGEPAIREAICDVMRLENISAHPDDVMVSVGSQQGLDLLTRIFCNPGDVVICEAPSYVGALGVFRSYQCEVVHVAMDEQGLNPSALADALRALRRAGRTVKFLYTIPNHHNPAGVTQSLDRRLELLQLCERADLLVVEDNPYGLLGFDGEPIPALRSMNEASRHLPRLVLQDVRSRIPGRLGARPARRTREAGARPGGGNAVPARLLPVCGRGVPGQPRLARTDQGLPRDVSRTARCDDHRADQSHAGRHHAGPIPRAASSSG